MNFKQLEYFAAVAEAKSISGASRELHVAQPPISRQLALLEDELGVTLFLRNNKGVELTEAGRRLYDHSRQMFQSLRSMAENVREVDAGVRGELKLGMVYSDVQIATRLMQDYHGRFPQVELYVRMGAPEDLLDALDREIAPLGIATWKRPTGGYFVSLDTSDGLAKRTLALCKEAGVVMTSAGATFPNGNDPRDRNIRIAPSLPPVAELELAIDVFCVCLRLAALEKLMGK